MGMSIDVTFSIQMLGIIFFGNGDTSVTLSAK
jgi:hypothetical protein